MNKMKKYCRKCGKWTEHIQRVFGNIGGFLGDAHLKCIKCGSVYGLKALA